MVISLINNDNVNIVLERMPDGKQTKLWRSDMGWDKNGVRSYIYLDEGICSLRDRLKSFGFREY